MDESNLFDSVSYQNKQFLNKEVMAFHNWCLFFITGCITVVFSAFFAQELERIIFNDP